MYCSYFAVFAHEAEHRPADSAEPLTFQSEAKSRAPFLLASYTSSSFSVCRAGPVEIQCTQILYAKPRERKTSTSLNNLREQNGGTTGYVNL